MAFIVATSTGLPSCYYTQEVLATALRKYFLAMHLDFDLDAIDRFFTNVMIKGRHFALPLETFYDPPGTGITVSAAIEAAINLLEVTLCGLLKRVKLDPKEISQLTSVSVIPAVPSLDARLMNRLPLSPNLKRVPIAGLGCMGGTAGIARVADYLQGHPEEAAIVLSVELSSVLWQGSLQSDLKDMIGRMHLGESSLYSDIISNIVTAALFGDGAAAVLMVGRAHHLARSGQPQVIDSRSLLIPNTEHLMGMDIVDAGFRIVLKPEVAEVVKIGLRQVIEPLLADHNLSSEKISRWIVHPGGPKVLEAVQEEFGLDDEALQLSYETLERVGNLSSATVLFMLDETLSRDAPPPGSYGLMMSMGPGFSQEVVLLRW